VVTPVGGLTEQVIDRETGVIARAATPEAVADAVRSLAETPGLYTACRLGVLEFARKHAFDRFARTLGDAALDLLGRH
jgi:glycosyltransferase involved in cell wall biosynthesis